MQHDTKISVRDLNLYYGQNHALKDIRIDIPASALYDIASKIASMVKELTEHND